LGALKSDPSRVLREYALEPLRAELRAAGARVLVVRDPRGASEQQRTFSGFDAVWLELDSLEGIDADALGRDVAHVLRPGARLVCLVPGGTPLLASLHRALRGHGDAARLRERRVRGAAWRAGFAAFVHWRRIRGLGVLLPEAPEWARRHPLAFALLAAAEHVVSSRPPFRALGAWALFEGVRR
jgi:hypothetical protein